MYQAEIFVDSGRLFCQSGAHVCCRAADGLDFLEFKATYAAEKMCGHSRIHGHLMGILGNNGPIQSNGSAKAAQFIQLCDQTATPLVFLQNTTGYMVGSVAERSGAVKHGSKMIQAVANAGVPKFEQGGRCLNSQYRVMLHGAWRRRFLPCAAVQQVGAPTALPRLIFRWCAMVYRALCGCTPTDLAQ